MLMIEKRMPNMQTLVAPTVHTHYRMNTTATATKPNMEPIMAPTPISRKRKIIVDHSTEKRQRTWTELEYEEMVQEATLLREELELLIAVAHDLCQDLDMDQSAVEQYVRMLQAHEELMASSNDVTVQQIRQMCQQMVTMMQYLCRVHYDHFAMIDMQDQLRECRNRFMRFICQYATMLGLRY